MNLKLQDSCSVCGSNSLYIACMCNHEINSLCKSCLSYHLIDLTVSHELISMDLASSLISDPLKLEEYYEDISTAQQINSILNSKFAKLARIRKTISESKQEIFTQLEGIFNDMLSKVEESYQEVNNKSKVMNEFKMKLTEEGKEMLEMFRRKGDQDILQECLENVEISVEEIIRKVKEIVRVQYPENANRKKRMIDENREYSLENAAKIPQLTTNIPEKKSYSSNPNPQSSSHPFAKPLRKISYISEEFLYIPKQDSKYLIKFNFISSTFQLLSFESMNRNFNHTSTCKMPDGSIISAGYYDPVSSEVYLLNPHSQESIPLPGLSSPRYLLKLFYHSGYVYAFGGKNTENQIVSTAERLNLSNNNWEPLPDMKYSNRGISCISIKDKIYLFCGFNRYLDVFNPLTLQFEEDNIDNSEPIECDGVAGICGDKIYLQTSSLIQVYDLKLNKLAEYYNSSQYARFSLTNVIQHQDSIFYHNFYKEAIMQICTSNLDFSLRYSHNTSKNADNRFIYTPNNGTYELLQFDIHNNTLKAFNLESHLHSTLLGTGICMLPDGQLFIAGFSNPVSGACYIYNPIINKCRRLSDMPTPRSFLTLVYCKNFIFAIGGEEKYNKTSKALEKFDLAKEKWKVMSGMIKPRVASSCVVVENKIYIMGGSEGDVEIYDIKFSLHRSRKVKVHPFSVCFRINERIFVIEDRYYKVYGLDLKKFDHMKIKNFECERSIVLGNLVIYEDSVYFYNELIRMYEKLNFRSGERTALVIKAN